MGRNLTPDEVLARIPQRKPFRFVDSMAQASVVALSCFEPKSDHGGMRGSLDAARQVTGRLGDMEQGHFDGRQ